MAAVVRELLGVRKLASPGPRPPAAPGGAGGLPGRAGRVPGGLGRVAGRGPGRLGEGGPGRGGRGSRGGPGRGSRRGGGTAVRGSLPMSPCPPLRGPGGGRGTSGDRLGGAVQCRGLGLGTRQGWGPGCRPPPGPPPPRPRPTRPTPPRTPSRPSRTLIGFENSSPPSLLRVPSTARSPGGATRTASGELSADRRLAREHRQRPRGRPSRGPAACLPTPRRTGAWPCVRPARRPRQARTAGTAVPRDVPLADRHDVGSIARGQIWSRR